MKACKLKRMKRLCGVCISCAAISFSVNSEPFAIYTLNPDANPISKTKAQMLFLGKLKSSPGIGRVSLLDWPQSSPHREAFYQKLIKRSVSQVNKTWAGLAFSGKGKPPQELDNNSFEEQLSWLNAHSNGLAYGPLKDVPDNANIILTMD